MPPPTATPPPLRHVLWPPAGALLLSVLFDLLLPASHRVSAAITADFLPLGHTTARTPLHCTRTSRVNNALGRRMSECVACLTTCGEVCGHHCCALSGSLVACFPAVRAASRHHPHHRHRCALLAHIRTLRIQCLLECARSDGLAADRRPAESALRRPVSARQRAHQRCLRLKWNRDLGLLRRRGADGCGSTAATPLWHALSAAPASSAPAATVSSARKEASRPRRHPPSAPSAPPAARRVTW